MGKGTLKRKLDEENRPITTSSEAEDVEETEADFLKNGSFSADSEVVLRQPQSPRMEEAQPEPSTSKGSGNQILRANPEITQLLDAYFANRF